MKTNNNANSAANLNTKINKSRNARVTQAGEAIESGFLRNKSQSDLPTKARFVSPQGSEHKYQDVSTKDNTPIPTSSPEKDPRNVLETMQSK